MLPPYNDPDPPLPRRPKWIGTITVGETSWLDSTKFSSTSRRLPSILRLYPPFTRRFHRFPSFSSFNFPPVERSAIFTQTARSCRFYRL